MRITEITYVVQVAGAPEDWTADEVAGLIAHDVATSIGPVAGIRFDEARDLTEEEWRTIQGDAVAEGRAVFV